MTTQRHRTAIKRKTFSTPIKTLLASSYITTEVGMTVFDYGCGHGDDMRLLKKMGISASGFDPYYAPAAPKTKADIVNLGFILNVIEDPDERIQVLQAAWKLTKRALAVAVIRSVPKGKPFSDGIITSRDTFQKLYTNPELHRLLQNELQDALIEKKGDRLFVAWRKDAAPSWVKA